MARETNDLTGDEDEKLRSLKKSIKGALGSADMIQDILDRYDVSRDDDFIPPNPFLLNQVKHCQGMLQCWPSHEVDGRPQ